jgi:hypothetical protein
MDSSDWITPRKSKAAKIEVVSQISWRPRANFTTQHRAQLPRQVSELSIPFKPEPVLECVTKEVLDQCAAEFNVYYTLVKAGAKWGDVELFDLSEWTELLDQRQRAPLYIAIEDTMESLVEAGIIKRAFVPEPEPEPEPEPRVVLPSRPPCEVCGVYLSHSNPPKDFNGRNLCCGWCFKKKGTDHGERCERCVIYTKNTSPFDEY